MRVLLLSGLGPTLKNEDYLAGSLFEAATGNTQRNSRLRAMVGDLQLTDLHLHDVDGALPLLRPAAKNVPHLTTFTLRSILENAGMTYDFFDLVDLWSGQEPAFAGHYDAVLLSTTYIWERRSLRGAITWARQRYPTAELILGGQYSNLKCRRILADHSDVKYIIRGDGEEAIPLLLRCLSQKGDIGQVPNLVFRDHSGSLATTLSRNIDLEAYPSPSFVGRASVVPYESMRGCPFSCKFCSFPAASPVWRYKSPRKIVSDWSRYSQTNSTTFIQAMDSTFTVPPTRLRQLFRLLPVNGVKWQAFTRANSIKQRDDVERLIASGCASLAIGFESMSDTSLEYMNKKVTAAQNVRAFELLNGSDMHYKISFMAGYPGETPEEYFKTHDFLVKQYSGHFMLNVFSIQDETMPVWTDAGRFQLRVSDDDDPDYTWEHVGMSAKTARTLVRSTLDEVRRKNDRAVLKLWQGRYQRPIPFLSHKANQPVEKLVERLAMLPRDYDDAALGAQRARELLRALADLGICSQRNCQSDQPAPAELRGTHSASGHA